MRSELTHLSETIADWGPSEFLEYDENKALWALTQIGEKKLCDFNSSDAIKAVAKQLYETSVDVQKRLTDLDAKLLKTLLILGPEQFKLVTTDDFSTLYQISVMLDQRISVTDASRFTEENRRAEVKRCFAKANILYAAVSCCHFFADYGPCEQERHLRWFASLSDEDGRAIGYPSQDDAALLNQYHAWMLIPKIPKERCLAVLRLGIEKRWFDRCDYNAIKVMIRNYDQLSPDQQEKLSIPEQAHTVGALLLSPFKLDNYLQLDKEQRIKLSRMMTPHIEEMLLLTAENRSKLLGFDIDNLNLTAKKLSAVKVYCEEAESEGSNNGWSLISQFGYTEAMRRMEMAETQKKVRTLIAKARELNSGTGIDLFGYGSLSLWRESEHAKTIRTCGHLKWPTHYPLDAPEEARDLDKQILDAKRVIAAYISTCLAAGKTTESSWFGRSDSVKAFFAQASEIFPDNIGPPSSSPSAASSEDGLVLLPSDEETKGFTQVRVRRPGH
ncbi:MAG: hypothetical protein P1U34_00775 [Coxiellaceae bacterium]|nr:hypothetical protein [Coxiellaceae bacterium]